MEETKEILLEEATIDHIQSLFGEGKLSSKELTMYYLKRIAELDKNGPHINAVIEINPDALFIAEAMDKERKEGKVRSAWHGIPVLLKDNVNTDDAMHTSAGSLAMVGNYAAKDAHAAAILRKSGAVILGKTNLTEWANFMALHMPNGYSSRGGQVQNPYGSQFDVSGSSSGSAAAVSANFCMAAVGTETSGSIVCPASSNSIVGIKPTVGLVSRQGIIPISSSQDTAGPMARTVKDAALLLEILAGVDQADPATWKQPESIELTSGIETASLVGLRIGISEDYFFKPLNDSQKKLFERTLNVLELDGATIVKLREISPLENEDWDYNVLLHEFKSGINAYLSKNNARLSSLKEIIEFNNNQAESALLHGQELLLASEKTSGTLTEPAYLNARLNDLNKSQNLGIDKSMAEYSLDAIVYPTNVWYGIPAKAGYPSISVPAGFEENGTPFGISFCAEAFSEKKLVRIAYAFEQATHHRKAPKL
ncbi:amidase family protein [Fictibacillus iocasae]|uniref:Amidase family protein n=1 Tax=Fictibacillus iocasae TaxID=2715437 RepID=A0ABW2NRI7_9BACL